MKPKPYTPLHSTPYALHPTPYTLHPTPYTLHPTPKRYRISQAEMPGENMCRFVPGGCSCSRVLDALNLTQAARAAGRTTSGSLSSKRFSRPSLPSWAPR